ncbi:hypothetical protein JOM56_004912 [Amanita muscaria]
MYYSVVPESDASRPVAGSTNMGALKTRSLLRPAAHNLSLFLVEDRSFQFRACGTPEPSKSGDDNGSVTLPSVRSRLDHESVLSVTPWKSSKRTLLSALPTGSVYSQESSTCQTAPVCADTRRFAIALESPDINDLWPLATSPLSASIGAFILNLRKVDEPQEITPLSMNFVAETALDAPYLVTSPKLLDATMAMLDEITTCFQIPAGEQNSLVLLPQPSRDLAVASAAPAYEYEGDTASGISASTLENGVEPGKGNPLLPTRGLGGLLSRISLPTKPHTSTAVTISSILDGSAETVSMVPRQDAASVVKRHRTLRKRAPSTPRKQTFQREQATLFAQETSTVPTQEFPILPLPAISVSPLAVSFEGVKDKIIEHGSNTPIPYGDWETIGVAF